MTRNIDELSNLRSEPPEQYFGKMRISKEQKAKRVEYTKKANDILDLILVLLLTMDDKDFSMYAYLRDRLESELLSLMNEYAEPDDYLIDYASDFAYNFIDVTRNNIENEWFTSSDRALYNAENCANDFHNYVEYRDAVMAGKTHKKWLAEPDNKVRESHQKVDGKKIPIKEFFRVGLARMRFPKDYEFASVFPRELINCRCGIEYLPKTKDFETTQSYRHKLNYDEQINSEAQGTSIISYPVIGSPNNISISNELQIKPKQLQEIENKISMFKKKVGITNENPNIVLVGEKELVNDDGNYNLKTNTIFYHFFPKDEILQDHTIIHELFHCKDAHRYLKNGINIKDIISHERFVFKKKLDKLGINKNNVNTIKKEMGKDEAIALSRQYEAGKYDEVYTEYRTYKIMEE